ncbi:hypothetical protein PG5_55150 [Pseudomonas sp. G5(2012)]|nr:hypothetical protein PG5_55150 [Pseudomonas sp. G5(2012)]
MVHRYGHEVRVLTDARAGWGKLRLVGAGLLQAAFRRRRWHSRH